MEVRSERGEHEVDDGGILGRNARGGKLPNVIDERGKKRVERPTFEQRVIHCCGVRFDLYRIDSRASTASLTSSRSVSFS